MPLTAVTVAFGAGRSVLEWAEKWSAAGCRCIICDNGGSLTGHFPRGTVILPHHGNPGFGAGINRSVEIADTPLVLVTNPDTLPFEKDSVSKLVKHHGRNTISAGLTVDRYGTELHSTGVWPCLKWVRNQVLKPAGSLWKQGRIDWLQGSLMLVEREDFLNIGGFHKNYPLYFEDTDLCARAKKSGMEIRLDPGSRFIHISGTGSSGSSALRLSCFHWGMAEFFRNNRPLEFHKAKRLIILKCIVRVSTLGLFKPAVAQGYIRALNSLLRNSPPELPERSHD